ncbi:sensor histidine kinase [Neptunicella marina]|uniref:histidine kinase n=1 Tax=Neptunicella marina TaxID=2125989 RepID=A0A8J6IW71_9ALTE|nr:HAMP domain-containing sensor histidine kinase [Neptunicella marina]MBC3767716.1 HAMP domain-containing histidine kinase [Neptunicella marina]
MAMSLYQRLAISLVLVFLILLSLMLWGSEYLHRTTRLAAEQRLHLGLAEHLVQDNPLLAEGSYDHDALENLFHTLMLLGPSFEFYYIDPNGNILSYSAKPGEVKRTRIDLTPVKHLLQSDLDLPVVGDDPRNLGLQKIFSVAPVYKEQELQGYLYMIIGSQIYDNILANIQQNQTIKNMALLVTASMLFLMICLLILFRYFTAPLYKLTSGIKSIQQAGYQGSLGVLSTANSDSSNEIEQLSSAFSQMLMRLQQQYEQLQQIDQQRRVLLADLSHDLRTPLASLQGYIETLALNPDSLSEQDRQRFTQISLKNAQNLKHLIDQIFELAYLEGGQVTLNQESFPLGELLHDVLAKFALKADDKSITLSLNPSQFEYLVFADIGKLERVLSNLIDNAIRHTPEGGAIDIRVSETDEQKLRIDLRDTGVGISESELAFIFDARYQASTSKTDKNLHAGLGLAISRKLMLLLDSDLKVQSELGEGTCFSFELKRV